MGSKSDYYYNSNGYTVPNDSSYCNHHPETCCCQPNTFSVYLNGKLLKSGFDHHLDFRAFINKHEADNRAGV